MKYLADFQKDRCYAVDANGDGKVRSVQFTSVNPLAVVVTLGDCHLGSVLFSEENGVGARFEIISREEFETFGTVWVWNPRAPFSNPQQRLRLV